MIGAAWAPRPVGPPPAEVLELEPDDPIAEADAELEQEWLELSAADRRGILPAA